MAKTIELVGDLPKYMRDRVRAPCVTNGAIDTSSLTIPPFAGLDSLLSGQPDLYTQLIKACLAIEPQNRANAEALLQHPLFTYQDHEYPSETIAEIHQNLVMNNQSTAVRYQVLLFNVIQLFKDKDVLNFTKKKYKIFILLKLRRYRFCWHKRPPWNKRPPKTVIFQRGEYTKPMRFGISFITSRN